MALKLEQMLAYGAQGTAKTYQEDHLIPLQLWRWNNGRNQSLAATGPSANATDSTENALNKTRSGRMPLAETQRRKGLDHRLASN
jgi:hypothetical protein